MQQHGQDNGYETADDDNEILTLLVDSFRLNFACGVSHKAFYKKARLVRAFCFLLFEVIYDCQVNFDHAS